MCSANVFQFLSIQIRPNHTDAAVDAVLAPVPGLRPQKSLLQALWGLLGLTKPDRLLHRVVFATQHGNWQ